MREYLFKTKAITRCYECPFRDGLYCLANDEKPINKYRGVKTRESFCPLVEVQAHGDLKDWEKIKEIFSKYLPNVDDDTNELLCTIMVDIGMNAPNVIEASTDGTEERE